MATETIMTCDGCGLKKPDITPYQISVDPIAGIRQSHREVDLSPDLCGDCVGKIETSIRNCLTRLIVA
jgi:hypothetical protein